jgi:hypothetical protein
MPLPVESMWDIGTTNPIWIVAISAEGLFESLRAASCVLLAGYPVLKKVSNIDA